MSNFDSVDELRVSGIEDDIAALENDAAQNAAAIQGVDYKNFVQDTQHNFIDQGCEISGNSGTMTIAFSRGSDSRNRAYCLGFMVEIDDNPSAGTVSAADPSQARIDLVYVNKNGQIGILAGSPGAGVGNYAGIAENATVIAEILVPAGITDIASATITDVRKFYGIGNRFPTDYVAGKVFELTEAYGSYAVGLYFYMNGTGWTSLASGGSALPTGGTAGQVLVNASPGVGAWSSTLSLTTITATTLNGTLGTAAQPNITSLGTLTGLSVYQTSGTGFAAGIRGGATGSGLWIRAGSISAPSETILQLMDDGGTTRAYFIADGKVGLGANNSAPYGTLDIVPGGGGSVPVCLRSTTASNWYGLTLSYGSVRTAKGATGFAYPLLLGAVGAGDYQLTLATDGKVGINKQTPLAKLHVESTTEQLRLGYDASNYTSFTVNSSGYLSLGGSSLRVGIGTASPQHNLDFGVYGSIGLTTGNTRGFINNRYLTSGYDHIALATNWVRTDTSSGTIQNSGLGTGEAGFWNTGTNAVYYAIGLGGDNTAPDEKFRITISGNVGIGTASPSSPSGRNKFLEISATSGVPGLVLGTQDGAYSNKQWEIGLGDYSGATGLLIWDGSTPRFAIDNAGNVGIGTTSPTSLMAGTSGLAVHGSVPGITFSGTESGGARFTLYENGGALAVYKHSGSSYPFYINPSGNVGIGTTTPTDYGSGFTNLEIAGGTKGGALTLGITGRNAGLIYGDGSQNALVYDPGSGNNHYFTGGKVGIGTASPGTLLEVETAGSANSVTNIFTLKNAQSGAASVNSGLKIVFENNNGASASYIESILTGGSNGNELAFHTQVNAGSVTEKMRIDSNGNVGIGTAIPTHKLHIEVAPTTTGLKVGASSSGDAFAVTPLSSGNGSVIGSLNSGLTDYEPLSYYAESHHFRYRTGVGTVGVAMDIDSSGNVSIGTAPAYAYSGAYVGTLSINGNASIANYAPTGDLRILSNAYHNGSAWKYISSSVAACMLQPSGSNFTINMAPAGTAGDDISWSERFHIANGGQVGIGDGAPATINYLLSIMGDSYVNGVGIALSDTHTGIAQSFGLYVAEQRLVFYDRTGGKELLRLDEDEFYPAVDGGVILGGSGARFGGLYSKDADFKASSTNVYAVGITSSAGTNLGGFFVDGSSGAQLYLKDSAGTAKALLNYGGSSYLSYALGVGVTSPSAMIHALSTTEQLRLGYDSSHFASHTITSAGDYNLGLYWSGTTGAASILRVKAGDRPTLALMRTNTIPAAADAIISGISHGYNGGSDVTFSGEICYLDYDGGINHIEQRFFADARSIAASTSQGKFSFNTTYYSTYIVDSFTIKPISTTVVSAKVKGALSVGSYTVAGAPSASTLGAGAVIYVSNGAAGNPVLAFSDGTNWLRCDTLATISAS